MVQSPSLAHSPTLASSPGGTGERLAPGTSVGEYQVDHFLGAGAMGEVYAGKHPVIGKKVAIKVLKADVAASPDSAERFKREAQAASQIDHANVVDTFAFGRLDDGRLYLVMDLVEGRSLRRALEDGPLPTDEALRVLGEIADALDAAHARGVVHRDLKPDNVMLGSGTPARVFVLDFGLAKLISHAEGAVAAATLTSKGTWLGTPGYMAPEQWSADGAGPASDRYALGVMAFELLSGSLPFEAKSLPQMMEQHFRAEVPALSARGALGKHVAAFDPIVSRAMAKDPERRFETSRAMVDELRAVAAGAPTRPAVATRAARPAWIPAVAAAGLLGLGVAVVLVTRGQGGRSSATPAGAATGAQLAGHVQLEIYSVPKGAQVFRGGQRLGPTPALVEAAAGTSLAFDVRKPGYAPAHHELTVPDASTTLPAFMLVPISRFEGIWALPSGELRELVRASDDRVAVFKRRDVAGDREFFRHYAFAESEHGVAFAADEAYVHPGAPNEPTCHIPRRVEYRYEPETDALSVALERVDHALVNGRCIIQSRALEPAIALARVDASSGAEHAPLPPVGRPPELKGAQEVQLKKGPPPIDNDEGVNLDKQGRVIPPANEERTKGGKNAPPQKPVPQKVAPQNGKTKAPAVKSVKSELGNATSDIGASSGDLDGVQQKSATPPPAQQKQNLPQAVRGDAQVAPPIQQQQRRK